MDLEALKWDGKNPIDFLRQASERPTAAFMDNDMEIDAAGPALTQHPTTPSPVW